MKQKKMTKLLLSSENENYETLIIEQREELGKFNYHMQRKIAQI